MGVRDKLVCSTNKGTLAQMKFETIVTSAQARGGELERVVVVVGKDEGVAWHSISIDPVLLVCGGRSAASA